MKRQRGRGRKPNNPGNRSYESNGPDVKIRGNANQIYDKYLQYARDAQTSGDRINAEAYFQHAEHYYRIMAANMPKEKLPGYQDDQDGRDDEARADDQSDNDADNEASSENEGGRKPRQSRSQSSNNSDGLDIVDGEGESPDDISAKGEEKSSEGSSPRRRRPRRPRNSDENGANGATEAKASEADAGDDAGLRAMMARSGSDDLPSPENPQPAES